MKLPIRFLIKVEGVMGICRCKELVNLKTTKFEYNWLSVFWKLKIASLVLLLRLEWFRALSKIYSAASFTCWWRKIFFHHHLGKYTVQPVAINTLSKISRLMTDYLKMKDTHLYTGHCFWRTSVTFLVNASADIWRLNDMEDAICRL